VSIDKTRVGLFTEIFASIAEEMGEALERVSFSPNIKERRDYSCALFATDGTLIAQAAHIPVHLGAMEFLMKRWLSEGPPIEEGKFYWTNDPYFAGTHLPDISVLRSVGEIGYVACRAHHADVGGKFPGSMAPAKNVHDEGFIIAPSEMQPEEFLRVARGRSEREGDLAAQRAAVTVGAKRFQEMATKFAAEFDARWRDCIAYAELITREALRTIPEGDYAAEDAIEDITPGNINLTITSNAKGSIRFDFTGTAEHAEMGINATEAVTRSACYYVVRCLAQDAPTNGGCWKPVSVIAPKGTLVNPEYPFPVAAGNTETSQRIVDVILQALAKAIPNRIPACSQGTMNNVAFGTDKWAYYETVGGGSGAGPNTDGANGIHTHMTNTRNTPVEALEMELPLRVTRFELRRGSGGAGERFGGEGVIREYEALEDGITATLMTDRRTIGPPGANGGMPGAEGDNHSRPSKGTFRLKNGEKMTLETPGGGGFGDPEKGTI
jgi:N-methylhydantoinase B